MLPPILHPVAALAFAAAAFVRHLSPRHDRARWTVDTARTLRAVEAAAADLDAMGREWLEVSCAVDRAVHLTRAQRHDALDALNVAWCWR